MSGIPPAVRQFLEAALSEDIGPGDITSLHTVAPDAQTRAVIIAKESLVVAGITFSAEVFRILDSKITIDLLVNEGDEVSPGRKLLTLKGRTVNILAGERLALNILQRLSGIATLTRKFVKELEGSGVTLLDTRKTTPCMRFMEKHAVRMGGGKNHRFGLFDGVLIKDNHISAAGGIREAIRRVRENVHHLMKIEVEVGNLEELEAAVEEGADIVMLDNFKPGEIRQAVEMVINSGQRPAIEVSGGITLQNIKDYAIEGVDFISTGSITHSARAVDISLELS
jgi:nicotinate-nucleotide pyrophosphorylase (carboxylating)